MAEVTPPPRPPLRHKLDAIRRSLDSLEKELGLSDTGQCLTVEADRKHFSVNLVTEGGAILGWQADLSTLVADLVDRVRRSIQEHERAT
jgi:hypothetical protein